MNARRQTAALPGEEVAEQAQLKADFENVDIYFEFDKFSLTSESRDTLRRKYDYLKEHPDLDILIEGLSSEIARGLDGREDQLGLAPFDAARPVYQENNGRVWALEMIRSDGTAFEPTPGEPLILQLRVGSDRVEPQDVRLSLREPPDPKRIEALQRTLDEALSKVLLPA